LETNKSQKVEVGDLIIYHDNVKQNTSYTTINDNSVGYIYDINKDDIYYIWIENGKIFNDNFIIKSMFQRYIKTKWWVLIKVKK